VSHDDNEVAMSRHDLNLLFVGEVANDASLKQVQSLAPVENAIDGRIDYEVVGQKKAQFACVLREKSPPRLILQPLDLLPPNGQVSIPGTRLIHICSTPSSSDKPGGQTLLSENTPELRSLFFSQTRSGYRRSILGEPKLSAHYIEVYQSAQRKIYYGLRLSASTGQYRLPQAVLTRKCSVSGK
jgi:hypothetical protein